MAPHEKRTFGSAVVVGLVVTMLLSLPRVARADLGDEPSKTDSTAQGDDNERPKESILDKKPADAAVASKKAQADSTPFYENWKFWAIAAGVVVGAVVVVVAATAISHQANGGDVRPCNATFTGCFGAGH